MTEFLPGTAIAGGRYRLLAWHGGRPRLQFWQAVDAASGGHVALTLVDPDGELPVEFVHEILARTVRLKGIHERGVAPVLDVLHTGSFGVVVCEWIPGGTLRQIADTAPSPVAAATAMQFLAATAEEAHRAGLVLSVDHPSRLRMSTDGHVVLAFPASMLEATPRTDLNGIGCALYALLLNCWPVRDDAVKEWACASFDPEGRPAEPCAIDPRIPFLVSTTVTGLLREEGGIASAATLLTLLRQAAADATDGSDCRVMPPLDVPAPGYYAGFRNFGPDEQAAAARRSVMRVGISAAAAIIIVAVIALASSLNNMLGEHNDAVAMDPDKLGLNPVAPTSPPPQPEPTVGKSGEPVQPASASVFSPDGSPDSPGEAGAAIDSNPSTAWSTDRYYDADPFPKFKSGVGLLLKLEKPTPPGAVTVDLDCTGTVVQIRAAQSDQPKTLTETTELTPPTPLRSGQNRIPITDPAPVSNVLVWISKLGSADGDNRCALSEVGLQAASPPA
jgi:putative peptidoglycan lipid II flippase